MKPESIWRNAFLGLFGLLLAVAGSEYLVAPKAFAVSAPAGTTIMLPWITGSDAGYSTLVAIGNTSMDPYGTTPVGGECYATAYTNAESQSPNVALFGDLGTFAPGTDTVLTEAQVATATGLLLANSGERAQLYISCNFPFAHAQMWLVNPSGVITVYPGYIVPPSRSFTSGPEQLLN
jgi:hypothetical protein